jgi:hypothetical protein
VVLKLRHLYCAQPKMIVKGGNKYKNKGYFWTNYVYFMLVFRRWLDCGEQVCASWPHLCLGPQIHSQENWLWQRNQGVRIFVLFCFFSTECIYLFFVLIFFRDDNKVVEQDVSLVANLKWSDTDNFYMNLGCHKGLFVWLFFIWFWCI